MDSDLESLELCPPEEYNFPKAKERASVLWLVSKAHNNRVPPELRDPYYRDHEDQYRLKPQIVQGLASGELYCMALASIYADPNYHTLSHVGIVNTLQRKGVDVLAPGDGTGLNETTLTQNAPIRMGAHMSVIEAIMDLYIKEVLIPIKVFEVVRRFSTIQFPEEVPTNAEEAALLWMNASAMALRERIQQEAGQPVPQATPMQDLAELSDGCGLSSLLSFYCPDSLPWQELCLNDPMNLTDSLCNLQVIQSFCDQNLPHDICFLTLEDLLFMHETIRANMLALVADLMYLFEIRPAKCVVRPGYEMGEPEEIPLQQDEIQYNYTLRKARKLQNSCSHIPDLLLQPEGMMQRDKKGRRENNKVGLLSQENPNSDPEEVEQFSGYFNKLAVSSSAQSSPVHRNTNRRGSPEKTGRESSQDGSSTLENCYTQFNSIDDKSIEGEGQPLRRVPSQSHIQNFSGSQAALHMMDPDAPDPFQGVRDNGKQTSFAQLSNQESVSSVNLTYKSSEKKTKKPTTTWLHTPTGDENGEVEEMFSVRQQMDERRQRIEQERRASEEATKRDRQQTNKQVFLQAVVGKSSHNGNNGVQREPPEAATTSTSSDSGNELVRDRSPSPPAEQQKRRRNSAERLAKQEQALNSLIHSRSASHVNHLSQAPQSTFYLHEGGSPVHGGYPSVNMRRQWGPPAAPPMYPYGGYPPVEVMPYWASPPHPSWGASQPPQSLPQHTMMPLQHRPSSPQQQQQQQFMLQQHQQQQHYVNMGMNQQQMHETGYDREQTPSPPPAPPPKERTRKSKEVLNSLQKDKSDQQENTPPPVARREDDAPPVPKGEKEAFFISFGEDSGATKGTVIKAKPKLRPRLQPSRDEPDATSVSQLRHQDVNSQTITKSEGKRLSHKLDANVENNNRLDTRERDDAVGFVIESHSPSDLEMARKKEAIMLQSLKRRQEQEQLRMKKEQEHAVRRASEEAKRDEMDRKREEEKRRREQILEQYRLRKAQEESEKNGGPAPLPGSTPNGTINRRPKSRSASVTRPRPKSVHIGSLQDASLPYQSATSNNSSIQDRRLSMGGSQHGLDSVGRPGLKREPSYPDFTRYRTGPPSDGASDTASTSSSLYPGEYTGPKLFVKPSAKSNRSIILNALNVVLAGAVNADTKKRAINEINTSDAKHLLILFRGANLQFRGIYTYNPDRDEVFKIFGAGPKTVQEGMFDLFYKYNSGSKGFTQIHTKHLSATIDAFTIQNALWTTRKSVTSKFRSNEFM